MPVIGESEEGLMETLDSDKVLLIPRKIRSQEVVRRGFMSDALFQNITNVFHITGNDIVSKLPVPKNSGTTHEELTVTQRDIEEMHLDEHGDVNVTDDFVKHEVRNRISPEEKENTAQKAVEDIKGVQISSTANAADRERERKDFVSAYTKAAQKAVVEKMKHDNPDIVTKAVENTIKHNIAKEAADRAKKLYENYVIESQTQEANVRETISATASEEEKAAVENKIHEAKETAKTDLTEKAIASVDDFVHDSSYEIGVRTVIEAKAKTIKNNKLDEFKKHLKGFTRTIPSFLMAYGCPDFTLQNLEHMIPESVFKDVTSITIKEFKLLRDECKYFDTTVFNDAVKEFMRYREALSDYFEDDSFIMLDGHKIKDIFDLIPPQRTNQIYTPRKVVTQMLDYLEQENPGCFDDPDATFIDPYMKSGLYITEIVKRLYNSEKFKEIFPDSEERLDWIFKTNVYGLAPTEIIYRIATNYIFGFMQRHDVHIQTDHFRMFDALPAAQDGTLSEKLTELFG